MYFTLRPWQFYLVIIGGWIHRQQQEVIEYLRTENQVLNEKLGPKRILLDADHADGWQSGRGRHVVHAGYDSEMAPDVDRQEVGLQLPP